MATDDVENYLMKKINDSITESESRNHISETLFHLQSQFKKLRDLLKDEQRKVDPSKRREKLYHLNNVITEWLIVSKRRRSYSWESIRFACNLSRDLRKIRKDLALGEDHHDQTNGGSIKGSKNSVPGGDPSKVSHVSGETADDLDGDDHAMSVDSKNRTNRESMTPGSKTSVSEVQPTKVHGFDDFSMSLEKALEKKENRDDPAGDDHAMSVDSKNRTNSESMTPGSKTSVSEVDPTKVHGFDDLAMSLERSLVKKENRDGFTAIGIVGMAGVGKTTLCQLVFNGGMMRNRFLPRVWVSMPRTQEGDGEMMPRQKEGNVGDMKREIVGEILLSLGVEEEIVKSAREDKTGGIRRLILALRRQLIGKRYLIVLDDVFRSEICDQNLNSESTEALAYGLPKGSGGAVIFTSRSPEVAKKIAGGEENLRWIHPLSDEDSCWRIFKDAVMKDGTEISKLEDLKALIVEKCAGLPLSAKMMGEIMKENRKDS